MLELNSRVSSDSTHTLQVISKDCADLQQTAGSQDNMELCLHQV